MTDINEEFFPQINKVRSPDHNLGQSIIGDNNVVHPTAKNVIVNGEGNYIGEGCSNINMFNSSGCVVTSGVSNVSIMSSSGVTITSNDTVYINDLEIVDGVFVTSGVTFSQSYYQFRGNGAVYEMTLDDYTVEVNGAGLLTQLPPASGHTQVFVVKNISTEGQTVIPKMADTIDGVESFALLEGHSAIFQSNGSTDYVIIADYKETVIPSSGVTSSPPYVNINSAALVMTDANGTVEFTGSGSSAILPTANGQTQVFNIKNSQLTDVTVTRKNADTIEYTDTTIVLTSGDSVTVQSNGTNNWIII